MPPTKAKPAAVQVQVALESTPSEAALAGRSQLAGGAPPSEVESPPAMTAVSPVGQPPAMQTVAAVASPSAAFLQPVAGAATAPTSTTRPAIAGAGKSGVQRITFGQGEGAQPAPDYPREAALAHQQGAVEITFTIDPAGRVSDAAVSKPCTFPVLNQAALRAVCDRWRFDPGDVRQRVVVIEFQLR